MRLRLLLGVLLAVLCGAASVEAQQRVICVSGCSGGTTDTDDGSIAGSQSVQVIAGQLYVWNGSAWARAATDAGNVGTTTLRVIEATDSTTNTTLAAVEDNTAGILTNTNELASAINSDQVDVNVKQINGATPTTDLTFDMDSGAGTQTRAAVGLAVAASGGATQLTGDTTNGLDVDVTRVKPDGTNTMPSLDAAARRGYFQETDGTNSVSLDPCKTATKTTTTISVTTDTELVDGNASVKTYICWIKVVANAAEIVSIVEGDDGGTCGTNEVALDGSTTDAEGNSLAANGGWSAGNGDSSILVGKTAAKDVCVTVSGSSRVIVTATWVQR